MLIKNLYGAIVKLPVGESSAVYFHVKANRFLEMPNEFSWVILPPAKFYLMQIFKKRENLNTK